MNGDQFFAAILFKSEDVWKKHKKLNVNVLRAYFYLHNFHHFLVEIINISQTVRLPSPRLIFNRNSLRTNSSL